MSGELGNIPPIFIYQPADDSILFNPLRYPRAFREVLTGKVMLSVQFG